MFPETVRTDRLRLRRLSRETVPTLDLYEHCREGAPDVEEQTRYLSWNPHPHPKSTRDFLVSQEEAWEERRVAAYGLFPREGEAGAGEFAGNTGLSIDWDRRAGELGIWLRKPFWGRGYSGERADALLRLAFARLDLDLVSVSHVVDNEKSRRAIERYVERNGGRREGTFRGLLADQDGEVHDGVRYSVSQAEWREATDDGAATEPVRFDP